MTSSIASSQPYIGSKVSLITNSKVRYEGTLYTIDTTKCTIYLSNVRILGTEGRQTSRPVPAREETFDYIVFKAADIKDMVACQPGKQSELFVDPAIVSCSGTGPNTVPDLSPRPAPRTPRSSPESAGGRFRDIIRQGGVRSQDSNGQKDQTTPRSSRPVRTFIRQKPTLPTVYIGTNGGSKSPEEHTGMTPVPKPKDRITFDKDYDIQRANEQFQHEALSPEDSSGAGENKGPAADGTQKPKERGAQNGEEHGEQVKKSNEPYYNKSVSFFDHISCEKPEGGSSRPEWKRTTQRQFNEETFGPSDRPGNSRRGGRNRDPISVLVARPPPPIGMPFFNGAIYGMDPFMGGMYGGEFFKRQMFPFVAALAMPPRSYAARNADRRPYSPRNRDRI